MGMARKKFVIQKKMMQYGEFMKRIKKSLYYGDIALEEDSTELTSPLAEYASELFSEPQRGNSLQKLTKFSAGNIRVPNPCSFIMALIYLDRLNELNPDYVRNGISPSDLFFVSVVVSSKFYYDLDEESNFFLDDLLQDADMSLEYYKKLEIQFLFAIDWNINISNEDFYQKLQGIEIFLAKREGLRRGWLTYSELLHFLPSFTFAKFLINNISVLAVSYVAGVMTMAGAFFLVSHMPGLSLSHNNTVRESYKGTQPHDPIEIGHTNILIEENLNHENLNHIDFEVLKNTSIIISSKNKNEINEIETAYKRNEILDRINDNSELIYFQENYLHNQNSSVSISNIMSAVKKNLNTLKTSMEYNYYADYNIKKDIDIRFDDLKNYTKYGFWKSIYNSNNTHKIPLIWLKYI